MSKKRFLMLVFLLLALPLVMAACGGDDEEEGGDDDGGSDTITADEAEAAFTALNTADFDAADDVFCAAIIDPLRATFDAMPEETRNQAIEAARENPTEVSCEGEGADISCTLGGTAQEFELVDGKLCVGAEDLPGGTTGG